MECLRAGVGGMPTGPPTDERVREGCGCGRGWEGTRASRSRRLLAERLCLALYEAYARRVRRPRVSCDGGESVSVCARCDEEKQKNRRKEWQNWGVHMHTKH